MKKLLLTAFLFLLSINVFAQYPEVSIMDIQYQNPDSLLLIGDQKSPLEGDTVTVVGVVMVAPYKDANPDSALVLHAGSVPALYLQDTTETDWAGLLVRFWPGVSTDAFNVLDTGTVIRVTGVVSEYYTTTQFNVIGFEGSDVLRFMQRPQPVILTLDSLAELGGRNGKLLAEKWENVLIEVRDVKATTGGTGYDSYEIFDDNNTQVIVGDQSDYFWTDPPAPGTILAHVRGYNQTRNNVPNTGGHANLIQPAYPGDTEVATFPPLISGITRNIGEVGFGDTVTVSANISDPDGTVTEAKLIYRKNIGTHIEILMTNTSGDTWDATIPAQNDSSIVDYFVRAVDDSGFVSLSPSDTSRNRFFYLVLDRALKIQDVQYSPFGSGFSAYNGYEVTVRGIVSADTTDIDGNETGTASSPAVYVQNGTGPWSGIRIFGTETDSAKRGDSLTVTGPVFENFGVTQIGTTTSGAVITVNSTGNPVPDPQSLSTSEIDEQSDGTMQAEQWEGVLVKFENVTVTDENADGNPGPDEGSGNNRNYGDILVADASNINTRVDLQDGVHQYHNYWLPYLETLPIHVRTENTFDAIVGIMWYSFSNYKLIPRKDDDFVGFVTGIDDKLVQPIDYELSQNFPNPFNPSTKIQYALPVEGNVTLKVFNILGQEVMTLINNKLVTAGRYEVTFDASNLPSGIYLYRIQTDGFAQVKKMILLK